MTTELARTREENNEADYIISILESIILSYPMSFDVLYLGFCQDMKNNLKYII